jgi:signal transduction histidine kinase/ligand-binding sensor domain-containing protein/DNA-binding response OmpR family regulator
MIYFRVDIRYIAVLLVSLLSVSVNAQIKCKIEHYSTEDGLSHDAATCIMKDHEGFMWFGSWDGINRFDGHHFVAYKSSPGDMSQLKNDRIDQIVEDGSGYLWLKAYDNQIYRFDKKSERFLPISEVIGATGKKKIIFNKIIASNKGDIWLISASEGLFYFSKNDTGLHRFVHYHTNGNYGHRLPANITRSFYESADHTIWIGTPIGVARLARSGDGSYTAFEFDDKRIRGLSFNAVVEGNGRLYFTTNEGHIVAYNLSSKQFLTREVTSDQLNNLIVSKKSRNIYATTSTGKLLTIDPQTLNVISAASNSWGALYTIYEDKKGYLWLTPEKQGIIRFDPAYGRFQRFSQETGAKYLSGSHTRVFEDNNGIVWVCMKGGGFGYYDGSKGSIAYFYDEPGSPNHRFSNIITDLYYDKAGVLWLNTDDKGIDKVSFQPDNFNLNLMVNPGTFRAENEVRGILWDRHDRLWVGSKAGILYVYQQGKPLTNLFTNEQADRLGQVYDLMEDSRGNIWMGTKTNGLFKAVPIDSGATRYRLSHFLLDEKDPNSLSSNQVYALLEDQKGRIWIGTFDGGLNLVDGDGTSGKFIRTGLAFAKYPKDGFRKIRNMATDKTGNIWIATTDGLLVVDPNDQLKGGYRYITHTKVPGNHLSLGNNDIQFIFRDSKNTMWLGTSGGGLDQAVGTDPFSSIKFRNFTTKDGLPNDYVLSCTEDRYSNLWIATQNGLSKLNLKSRQFRNYDTYDGLPKTTFSEASCTRTRNLDPVFGTVKGYLSFDHNQIRDYKTTGNLVFTSLQVNNEDVNTTSKDGLLNYNINYTRNLRLRYDQNTVSVDYMVLSQRLSYRETYMYRLKGFDVAWRNNKNQRRATYTNLPSGNYTLEIKNVSTELYTNLPYRSLKIVILPPPWRTWWAYLIYAILTGILVAVIRRNALTMLRLRHNIAVEKKLAELKLSFFTNVSHELRTPLTLILNPIKEIEKILIEENRSSRGIEYIQVVIRNADRMVRFINQLLDLRKLQSGKPALKISQVGIVSFVTNITGYFADTAREKSIEFRVVSDPAEILLQIDAEKMDIVIYNVLANAFKFTPTHKKIEIQINEIPERDALTIAISDEGIGVAPDYLSDIFELYYEGEHGDGKHLKGTGIGLALAKELVELHHGRIGAKNNPSGGLTVTVELQLGKAHFHDDKVLFVDMPLFASELKPTVNSSLHSNPEEQQQHNLDKPLVLLVEDNGELRSFLNIQLSSLYRVKMAENGAEGLKKAREIMPDLIISDVMMPVMNGIEMLDQLKSNSATSHIPVIILSARSSVEQQIEGLKYGADYYITKPFNNDLLSASIEALLNKRKHAFEKLMSGKKVIDLNPSQIAITAHDEVFLKKVIGIVEEKMSAPEFSIDVVAEALNMSRSPFYKKFKSLTGIAPVEFVREMRLKRGKQYFDAGNLNVAEVSFLTGFSNSKYFNKCFKEKFGVSPTDYLKQKRPGTSPVGSIN